MLTKTMVKQVMNAWKTAGRKWEREREIEREREGCKESSITCLMQYHLIKQVILLFAHIAALCTGRFACQ